jgi:hypothetical protein
MSLSIIERNPDGSGFVSGPGLDIWADRQWQIKLGSDSQLHLVLNGAAQKQNYSLPLEMINDEV